MKNLIAPVAVCLAFLGTATASIAQPITGAGSSAAAPIYRAWSREYQKSGGAPLDYQPVGSTAGLKKIRAGETAFGASDIAPAEAELNAANLVVFPVAITGIAPVINVPRVADGQLRLSGELLARIFMGEIGRWDAAEIRQMNPGVTLPDLPIQVIGRADGSGTTYNFADYLAKVSPAWRERMGVHATLPWQPGVTTAKGSDGVVAAVKATTGAIGYVDFGYVADNKLTTVQMRNADGEFLRPGVAGFRAALAASDWLATGNFSTTLTQLHGRTSWPITMGTFVLVPRVSDRPDETRRALKFFVWAFNHGDALVQEASFVRLPDRVQAAVFKAVSGVRDREGKPIGMAVF